MSIDGDGVPVEYAIEMMRLDERQTMDHLAGEMDHELVDFIADAIAAAHAVRRSYLRSTVEQTRRGLDHSLTMPRNPAAITTKKIDPMLATFFA